MSREELTQKRFSVDYAIEQKLERITFVQEILHNLEADMKTLLNEQNNINQRLNLCRGM